MSWRPAFPLPGGRLCPAAVMILLAALVSGCVSLAVSEQVATREEPQEAKTFFLTADQDAYTVSRWWDTSCETVTVARRDLPAGCETARFFLGDASQELSLAEPATAAWTTGTHPPLPDDRYPPCSLLVSYGAFSGPPELEGVAITSAAGVVATGERIRPRPAVWALTPAAMVAEGYAMIGATLTLPLWGPALYAYDKQASSRKEQELNDLPPAVASCWRAIDDKVKEGWLFAPPIKVSGFGWSAQQDAAYDITSGDGLFSDDNPLPIDTRVTLHQGRIGFPSLEAEADIACGLHAGKVVAITVIPRR